MPNPVLARARRLAPARLAGNAVNDLLAGDRPEDVAKRRGLPLATVRGIRSFYDQITPLPRVCDGAACHFAGAESLRQRLAARREVGTVRCLGHCYDAPAARLGESVFGRRDRDRLEAWLEGSQGPPPSAPPSPIAVRSLADPPVVLRNLLGAARTPLGVEYEVPDGESILAALEEAGLRGRGGAAYPTAAKWRAARDAPGREKWVVANGDEGDPGSFVDRLLMESDPHAILAGMKACARAVGATRGVVYVRAEYPAARRAMESAVREAAATGLLGSGFAVEVLSGAGSYVCGEETALLNSIEGLRGEPRPKPPYPATSGLFGQPTVVQNVETLSVVPWIIRHRRGGGTKAVSLSGVVREPGVVEVPLGTPLREVLMEAGGGPLPGRGWKLALIGGALGRVVPAEGFDTPLSYEALPGMGHAGVLVLDERTPVRAVAEHLMDFARAESCGSCTPCRAGTAQLPSLRTRAQMQRLLETLEMGSLCGFGSGVARPLRDLLEHYGEEPLRC